jgi:hypothetical protein
LTIKDIRSSDPAALHASPSHLVCAGTREVFELVAAGESNKVVARQLGISFLFDRLFVYVVARIARRANGAVLLRNVK